MKNLYMHSLIKSFSKNLATLASENFHYKYKTNSQVRHPALNIVRVQFNHTPPIKSTEWVKLYRMNHKGITHKDAMKSVNIN